MSDEGDDNWTEGHFVDEEDSWSRGEAFYDLAKALGAVALIGAGAGLIWAVYRFAT